MSGPNELEPIGPTVERELAFVELRYAAYRLYRATRSIERLHRHRPDIAETPESARGPGMAGRRAA